MHAVRSEGSLVCSECSVNVSGSYCCCFCEAKSQMPCTEHFHYFLWPEMWPRSRLWAPSLGSQLESRGTLRTSFPSLLRPRRAGPERLPATFPASRLAWLLRSFPTSLMKRWEKTCEEERVWGLGSAVLGLTPGRVTHRLSFSEPKFSCL